MVAEKIEVQVGEKYSLVCSAHAMFCNSQVDEDVDPMPQLQILLPFAYVSIRFYTNPNKWNSINTFIYTQREENVNLHVSKSKAGWLNMCDEI